MQKQDLIRANSQQYNERTAIAHLKELHLEQQKFKYPSLPYYSAPNFSAAKTNGLTRCVIHFLRLKGHQAERISCEGRIIDNRITYMDTVGYNRTIGSIQYIKSSGQPGTADISATVNGQSVKLEIKNALTHDKQSEVQRQYQRQIEESGGVYVIITSLAMFINWFYSNMEVAK